MSVLLDDGLTQHLDYPSDIALALPISFSVWIKTDVTNINQGAFGHGDASATNAYWVIWVGTLGEVRFRRTSAAGGAVDLQSGTITANEWTHIAGVQSATNAVACYNNNAKTTATSTIEPLLIDKVTIGSFPISGNSFRWSGHAYWPAIWNVALSDDNVNSLFTGSSPRLVRREALKWFGIDRGDGEFLNVLAQSTPTRTGSPVSSTDNPFQAQGVSGRSRNRSRARMSFA